jgi:uncharacterized protein (TIGR01777 family)
MNVVIAGASGLIGSALRQALREDGHQVRRLVRRRAALGDEIAWDPARGELDPRALAGTDAVVNLAGESLADGRWTAKRRERILNSRTESTRTLVVTLRHVAPRPAVLLNASAVGYYGERGEEVLSERSVAGTGFLPEVCLAWETTADGAARAGMRAVFLRFGVVLARQGGALAQMLPLFRAGLGGRLGSGRQWMSWISLGDAVGAIRYALFDDRCRGPLNVVAPEPVRNAEFARALGRVLHRPAFLPVPALALRAVFGRMADEALLASTRAVPEKLIETGYTFRAPTLETALRGVLA